MLLPALPLLAMPTLVIAFPVFALAYHHRLLDIRLNVWTGLLTYLLVDFSFYWMHRASHRLRWFWAAHVVHHSSRRMNFSTAMRQNAKSANPAYSCAFG